MRGRVGLFGGTFDPIHLGHLRAAEEVQERFALDRVLFIPSNLPPHKASREIAPAADRLRMVKLAVAGNPRFAASSVEVEAGGTSYSIVTLRKVTALYPEAWVFLVLGVDAFLEIDTWRDYRQLLEEGRFIVMTRPGFDLSAAGNVLGGRLRERMSEVGPGEVLGEEQLAKGRIFLCPFQSLPIASTDIRARARLGQSLRSLVPRAVGEYIRSQNLYRQNTETMEQDKKKPLTGKSLPSDVRLAVKTIQDKKGEEPCVLDLRGLSSFTDFFVIVHGNSSRQNLALMEAVEGALRGEGRRPLGIEGRESAEWVLMDYGGLIVHVFSKRSREMYGLEKLWGDAPRLDF